MSNSEFVIKNLRANDLLYNLNHRDFGLLSDNKNIISFKRGDTIAKQGGFVTNAIYLSKGTVKKQMNSETKLLLLDIISSGNFISLPSTLTQTKHPCSIIAIEDTTVCFINIEIIKEIIINNGRFAFDIIHNACNYQRYLCSKLICFNKNNIYGRLAYTILYLADHVFNSTRFNILISRKELSQLVGLSRETVIKGLSLLHNDKIIFVQGKYIEILDYKKLQTISEKG